MCEPWTSSFTCGFGVGRRIQHVNRVVCWCMSINPQSTCVRPSPPHWAVGFIKERQFLYHLRSFGCSLVGWFRSLVWFGHVARHERYPPEGGPPGIRGGQLMTRMMMMVMTTTFCRWFRFVNLWLSFSLFVASALGCACLVLWNDR